MNTFMFAYKCTSSLWKETQTTVVASRKENWVTTGWGEKQIIFTVNLSNYLLCVCVTAIKEVSKRKKHRLQIVGMLFSRNIHKLSGFES